MDLRQSVPNISAVRMKSKPSTASDDATARLWDAESGKPEKTVFRGHKDRIRQAVFSADGDAVLTLADDGRGPGDGAGFGLAGMRDRLALVGGSAMLAGDGGGAVLTVRVPIGPETP